MSAAAWIDLVRGLLRLKRTGVLANVWIDAGAIRVAYPGSCVRRPLSWERARQLVARWREEDAA